jgi:hypothetical protein
MNQPNAELTKLQQTVRESRMNISREYSGLLSDLDFKKRFTESVKHHPYGWLGGAAAAGLIATIFGGRSARQLKPTKNSSPQERQPAASTPEVRGETSTFSKAGWIAGALEVGKILYPILRPVVVEFATNAAKAGLAKRFRP